MERKYETSKPEERETEKPQPIPIEIPRINGTKPATPRRTDENCKKHVRRDGRK